MTGQGKTTKTERWLLLITAVFCLLLAAVYLHWRHSGAGGAWGVSVQHRTEQVPVEPFIDVNTADEDLLQQLPGIGPELAARIVAYRTANGPFAAVEELTAVEGIGPATLETLRPYAVAEREEADR